MYQTLYRKYRPNTFNEVVGQNEIIKTLKNAISKNTINHAYLFTGPRGTGKTSVAKILAKTVNCLNLKDLTPCNDCVSCTEINNRHSIDIIEIDAASNNGVDEIRELKSKIDLVPSASKYKIYIIDEVHMLTTGAFNALLKTLEEPPSHIIFILATTEPHKIPMTILSRCQRFDFKKINKIEMKKRLDFICEKENIKVEPEAYDEIIRLSEGCMRDALSILEQAMVYSNEILTLKDIHEINGTIPQEQMKQLIIELMKKNVKEIFELIDSYDETGKNFVKLTEEIVYFLRNTLLKLTVPKYFEKTINDEAYDSFKEIDKPQIMNYINIFNKSINEIKKSNNSRIAFELVILDIIENNTLTNTENKEVKKIEAPVKSEKKETQSTLKITDETRNVLNDMIKVRVNNTLCSFNKKETLEFKKKIDEIRNLLMEPKYNQPASMILDGNLKALGNNNMVFVYKNKRFSDLYNINVKTIDSMLSEYFKKDYVSIAVSTEEWEQIKKEFNTKEKKYEYIEEQKELLSSIEKMQKSNIDNMFGNIVEYN